ncbi:MAG TPA: RNA polymerase sigma-70 factor [Cytophagales bacterium]|nr:RNA polymerase sigma-70 factor [Cytophagales bacterium]
MITRTIANDEKAVVQKLILGDELAFKQLYDKYKNILYTFCYRITKSEEWAEEIVHDVFLKIWFDRENINSDLAFGGYVYRITKNASINFIKKASVDLKLKKQYLDQVEKFNNNAENFLLHTETDRLLKQAIEKLPPQQQTVFRMCRIEGLTHAEISDALNLSKGTVKNYMMIAMANLKKQLSLYTDKLMVVLVVIKAVFF